MKKEGKVVKCSQKKAPREVQKSKLFLHRGSDTPSPGRGRGVGCWRKKMKLNTRWRKGKNSEKNSPKRLLERLKNHMYRRGMAAWVKLNWVVEQK